MVSLDGEDLRHALVCAAIIAVLCQGPAIGGQCFIVPTVLLVGPADLKIEIGIGPPLQGLLAYLVCRLELAMQMRDQLGLIGPILQIDAIG
jgi:hypothetical protein